MKQTIRNGWDLAITVAAVAMAACWCGGRAAAEDPQMLFDLAAETGRLEAEMATRGMPWGNPDVSREAGCTRASFRPFNEDAFGFDFLLPPDWDQAVAEPDRAAFQRTAIVTLGLLTPTGVLTDTGAIAVQAFQVPAEFDHVELLTRIAKLTGWRPRGFRVYSRPGPEPLARRRCEEVLLDSAAEPEFHKRVLLWSSGGYRWLFSARYRVDREAAWSDALATMAISMTPTARTAPATAEPMIQTSFSGRSTVVFERPKAWLTGEGRRVERGLSRQALMVNVLAPHAQTDSEPGSCLGFCFVPVDEALAPDPIGLLEEFGRDLEARAGDTVVVTPVGEAEQIRPIKGGPNKAGRCRIWIVKPKDAPSGAAGLEIRKMVWLLDREFLVMTLQLAPNTDVLDALCVDWAARHIRKTLELR